MNLLPSFPLRKSLMATLIVVMMTLGNMPPTFAAVGIGTGPENLAVDLGGEAQFDSEGNLYVAASKAKNLPFGSTFLYDMDQDVSMDSPVFLGDMEESTSDGAEGFYAYGKFTKAESQAEGDNPGILEGNAEGSLAHLNASGHITDIIDLEFDGDLNDMLYIPDENALFLVGTFGQVNGEAHQYLSCIHPDTGDFCVIDGYDWGTNTGFLTVGATQNSLTYDYDLDRLIIGGKVGKYVNTAPETVITVLNPALPTENLASPYLDIPEVDLPQNPNRPANQVLYFDTKADLDNNGTTEKLFFLFTRPIITLSYNNGAGYISNTQIGTIGLDDAILALQEGETNKVHLGHISDFGFGNELMLSPVPFSYNGVFSFTLDVDERSIPIDSGTSNETRLKNLIMDTEGDAYFSGQFKYTADSQNYYNFVGLNNAGEPFVKNNVMTPALIEHVNSSGNHLMVTGPFNPSGAEVINRSLLKIDPSDGTVDESFDLAFRDGLGRLIHESDGLRFLISGDYLYVYQTGGKVHHVYDISDETWVAVPKSNLFRINLVTKALDAVYASNIPGDPDLVSLTDSGTGVLYAATTDYIYALDDQGQVDMAWKNNFDNSNIDFTSIQDVFMGYDGYLYLALADTNPGGIQGIARGDADGNFSYVYQDAALTDVQAIYLFDHLIIAYEVPGGVALMGLDIDGQGVGTPSVDFDPSAYLLKHSTNQPLVRDIVKHNDSLFLSGLFDSVLDQGDNSEQKTPNLINLNPYTGALESQNFLTQLYAGLTQQPLGMIIDEIHHYFVLFGEYSFDKTEFLELTNHSLVNSNYGLSIFKTDSAPYLTEVTPVPAQIKTLTATYVFDLGGGIVPGEYISEDCGNNSNVQIDPVAHTYQIVDLKVGKTYQCKFMYKSAFGDSNLLQVGPFTVVASGGGGINGGGGGGSNFVSSEALKPALLSLNASQAGVCQLNPSDSQMSYTQEVKSVLEKGIVTKEPTKVANKCEALVMMSRVFNWGDMPTTKDQYTDTPTWCEPYAKFATERGIVQGRSENLLGMDTPLMRYEVAVMLYRELQKQTCTFEELKAFQFLDPLVAWAEEAVKKLAGQGIIKGFADGTFGGEKGILKQDLGVMLLRTIE